MGRVFIGPISGCSGVIFRMLARYGSAAEGDVIDYIIIVCAFSPLTAPLYMLATHTYFLSFSIARNARASVVLSSFYFSTSYNRL